MLHKLRAAPVRALNKEIPGRGNVNAFDVTPRSAWVTEHRPRASVTERSDTTTMRPDDPECTLDVTRSPTHEHATGSITEHHASPRCSGAYIPTTAAFTTTDAENWTRGEQFSC